MVGKEKAWASARPLHYTFFPQYWVTVKYAVNQLLFSGKFLFNYEALFTELPVSNQLEIEYDISPQPFHQ